MSKTDQNKPADSAVALKYDGQSAPFVSATAQGELAEQIKQLAIEHEIPLFENPQLAQLLAQLELGESIPEELYHCIAHIIAFAYKIQKKVPEHYQEPTVVREPSEPPDNN